MSFRMRFTLALFGIATLSLLTLGFGVRREMTARFDADVARRVAAVRSSLDASLAQELSLTRLRLAGIAGELATDNRFRIAFSDATSAERRWLLDFAPARMKLAGFAVLLVQDSTGRILSSGHFRNDFDRIAPAIQRAVLSSPGTAALVDARTPSGTVRAIVSLASITARGQRYTIIGGQAVDFARVAAMSADASVAAVLDTSDAPATEGAIVATSLPYVNESTDSTREVRILLVPDIGPTIALKAGVNRWLLITLGGSLLLALIAAGLLGGVISEPVTRLAHRAAKAEATGDMARQVNHDIKNGLAPLRNVLRHLSQTAETDPTALAGIYAERRGTLDSSVQYLADLASNYAKLAPRNLQGGPTDPVPVVLSVARFGTIPVEVRSPRSLPSIRMGALDLQRVLRNLIANAGEAMEGKSGSIILSADVLNGDAEQRVRFTVADTGRGMTPDELESAFKDFHTTKEDGTGLGLSVVRRLLTDAGGSVRAESAPGKGSTFIVEIPAV